MNDGSIEQEIAAARAAVEDLKRRGELSAADRDTLLTGLDALAGQTARHRAQEARSRLKRTRIRPRTHVFARVYAA